MLPHAAPPDAARHLTHDISTLSLSAPSPSWMEDLVTAQSAILLWGASIPLPTTAMLTLPCSLFLLENFFSFVVSQWFPRIQCPLCCKRCMTTVATLHKPGP